MLLILHLDLKRPQGASPVIYNRENSEEDVAAKNRGKGENDIKEKLSRL